MAHDSHGGSLPGTSLAGGLQAPAAALVGRCAGGNRCSDAARPVCLLLGIAIAEQLEPAQTGCAEPLGAVAAVSQPTRTIFLGFLA